MKPPRCRRQNGIVACCAGKKGSGQKTRYCCVPIFQPSHKKKLAVAGIETFACDLLGGPALQKLPNVENIIYMAGMKFSTSGKEWETRAINAYLSGVVANQFRNSRIVLFSTGNVYPLSSVESDGCKETDPVNPIGEYAQSALGRERIF